MKRIRIHSSRFINQLNIHGPVYSIIEVTDSIYESIIKAGHKVELIEDTLKRPTINKTVLECLEIKPKHTIIDIKEEVQKEEEKEVLEEEKVITPVVKTQLSSERIINRSNRNKRRGK